MAIAHVCHDVGDIKTAVRAAKNGVHVDTLCMGDEHPITVAHRAVVQKLHEQMLEMERRGELEK